MISNFGAAGGAEITGEADFDGHLPLRQFFNEFLVLVCGQAVADALNTKIQRTPNGFRAGTLPGVGGQPQALVFGIDILVAKELGRRFLFVTADANGNDVSVAKLCRELEHVLRRLGTKLADRVEDPKQRDAEIFLATFPAMLQALEDGFTIQLPP